MAERDYESFILREGDIATFIGGAIVVPAWTQGFALDGSISAAVNRELERQGHSDEEIDQFWRQAGVKNSTAWVDRYSTSTSKQTALKGVEATILTACYLDSREREDLFPIAVRAVTSNVIGVASLDNIRSLAMPIFYTGMQGALLEDVLPSMVHVFDEHHTSGAEPRMIALYAYGNDGFRRNKYQVAQHTIDRMRSK